MSQPGWEDVVDSPDELDDETAESLLEEGDALVQETDHAPSTENVPTSVSDQADARVWKSGDGRYRTFLREE